MKKTLISAAFATRFAAQAIAAPQTYSLDPTHSFPRFSYDHMGMSKQILRFNKTTGTVVLDQAANQAHVDVTIDMTSIDTGFEMFDGHKDRKSTGEGMWMAGGIMSRWMCIHKQK